MPRGTSCAVMQKLSGVAAYSKGQNGQSKHRTIPITTLGIKKQGITTGRLLAGISKGREGRQEAVI